MGRRRQPLALTNGEGAWQDTLLGEEILTGKQIDIKVSLTAFKAACSKYMAIFFSGSHERSALCLTASPFRPHQARQAM